MATIIYNGNEYKIDDIDGSIDAGECWDEFFFDEEYHGDYMQRLGLSGLSVGSNGHCVELYEANTNSFDVEDWMKVARLGPLMRDGLQYFRIKVEFGEAKVTENEDNDSPYDKGESTDRRYNIAEEITNDMVANLSSVMSDVASDFDKEHDELYDYSQSLEEANERDNVTIINKGDLGEIDEDSDLASEAEDFVGDSGVIIVVLEKGETEKGFWEDYRATKAKNLTERRIDPAEDFLMASSATEWDYDFRTKRMKAAVEAGADINATNDYGVTALYSAVMEKDTKLVEFLLDNGIDLASKIEGQAENAVNAAAWNGDIEMLRLLVERGADVAGVNNNNENALHNAISENNKEMTAYLLDYSLDVNNKNNHGWTVLERAFDIGDDDLSIRLIDMGARPVDAIKHSIEMYDTSVLSREDIWCHDIEGQWDEEELSMVIINNWGEDTDNTLFFALYDDSVDGAVDLAIDRMTAESINFVDDSGRTPLFAAVEGRDTEMARRLLERGANPNIAKPKEYRSEYGLKAYTGDEDGNTPLHVAVARLPEEREIAEMLMAQGARVDVKNGVGQSIMDVVKLNATEIGRSLSVVVESYEIKQSSSVQSARRRLGDESALGI